MPEISHTTQPQPGTRSYVPVRMGRPKGEVTTDTIHNRRRRIKQLREKKREKTSFEGDTFVVPPSNSPGWHPLRDTEQQLIESLEERGRLCDEFEALKKIKRVKKEFFLYFIVDYSHLSTKLLYVNWY